jgi:mono/diheme cytochrome c family protein
VECHGVNGDGHGPAAKFQPKPPRSFVTEGFRFRYEPATDRAVEAARGTVSEQDLLRTVTEGLPNSTMPAFAPLPPEDRVALVAYVRHLARHSASPGKAAPAPVTVPAPPARGGTP